MENELDVEGYIEKIELELEPSPNVSNIWVRPAEEFRFKETNIEGASCSCILVGEGSIGTSVRRRAQILSLGDGGLLSCKAENLAGVCSSLFVQLKIGHGRVRFYFHIDELDNENFHIHRMTVLK